jgi:hypothetical protein
MMSIWLKLFNVAYFVKVVYTYVGYMVMVVYILSIWLRSFICWING